MKQVDPRRTVQLFVMLCKHGPAEFEWKIVLRSSRFRPFRPQAFRPSGCDSLRARLVARYYIDSLLPFKLFHPIHVYFNLRKAFGASLVCNISPLSTFSVPHRCATLRTFAITLLTALSSRIKGSKTALIFKLICITT